MKSPENIDGCIFGEIDAFIKTFEEPVQQLKDQFAQNRELLLQQMDQDSLESYVNSIKEKNEAVLNETDEFFCKPPKPFKLKLEDLHFVPHVKNKANKNDKHYFQWPDAAALE